MIAVELTTDYKSGALDRHPTLNDLDVLLEACVEMAVAEDQNWEEETTTYIFKDGSMLVFRGEDISAYIDQTIRG
jgi:hypothetical protein